MKTFWLVPALLGVALTNCAADERSSIDELGHRVYVAVKSKDQETLAALCLLEESEVLALLKNKSPVREDEKQELETAIKNVHRIAAELRRTFGEGWKQIETDLQRAGKDMDETEYYGVSARILPFKGESRLSRVQVVFETKGKLFAIRCSDAYPVEARWKLEDSPSGIEEYSP